MKKIAFIDLDRTLFDVDEFKKEIGEKFFNKENPSTPEILELFYQNNPEFFEWTKKNINNFLFDESVEFLKKLKEEGIESILLTKGIEGFQKWKIENLTEINKYFDKEIYVENTKWQEIFRIVSENPEGEFYSFNDDKEQNKNFEKFVKKELGANMKIFTIDKSFNVEDAFTKLNFGEDIKNEINKEFKFK